MKLIEIIATLIILTTSIFIIHGVPNDQLDTIEFGDVDVTQIKSLLLDLSSRVQHLEKKNDDLNIQVQSLQEKNHETYFWLIMVALLTWLQAYLQQPNLEFQIMTGLLPVMIFNLLLVFGVYTEMPRNIMKIFLN